MEKRRGAADNMARGQKSSARPRGRVEAKAYSAPG